VKALNQRQIECDVVQLIDRPRKRFGGRVVITHALFHLVVLGQGWPAKLLKRRGPRSEGVTVVFVNAYPEESPQGCRSSRPS
jgi:hypothetical protein